MSKVWFITGTSKGFGRIWAEAALERGDRVVATARNAPRSTDLVERYGDNVLALELDVTDKAAVDAAVARAHEHFGRLDVVVNNAGYGLFGMVEEVSEAAGPRADGDEPVRRAVGHPGGAPDHARAALGPHHPGVLDRRRERVPDARALPRVQVGPRGLQPGAGAAEVAGFGIKVTLVEPAGYSTDWSGPSSVQAEHNCRPTTEVREHAPWSCASSGSAPPGDPEATGPAILELVDADEPPLRVFFGVGTLDMIRAEYAQADRELGALGRRSPSPRTGGGGGR